MIDLAALLDGFSSFVGVGRAASEVSDENSQDKLDDRVEKHTETTKTKTERVFEKQRVIEKRKEEMREFRKEQKTQIKHEHYHRNKR